MSFWKVAAVIGSGIVGSVLCVVAAPVVLPALGAAGLLGAAGTGTAIASLSGAALTSASCAAITGTIAGSTAVVATGGAVAGAIGGKIAADKIKK